MVVGGCWEVVGLLVVVYGCCCGWSCFVGGCVGVIVVVGLVIGGRCWWLVVDGGMLMWLCCCVCRHVVELWNVYIQQLWCWKSTDHVVDGEFLEQFHKCGGGGK